MKIKDDVLNLATLFFGSHTRIGSIDNKLSSEIREFIIQVCLDGTITYDNLFDEDDDDRINTLKEEVWKDILEEDPILWFALYLYNKGIMSEEQMKEALKGSEWETCCHGDYIEALRKKWNIKINDK